MKFPGSRLARWRCVVMFFFALVLVIGSMVRGSAQSVEQQSLIQDLKLEKEILSGVAHAYRFEATADTYIWVEVEQKSVDVRLVLYDSEGKEVVSEDSPHGGLIGESFELILPKAGQYRLEIAHAKPGLKPGVYSLSVKALRPALQTDRDWLKATECFNQAIYLRFQNTSESLREAMKKLDDAARFYRSSGRLPQQANAVESIGVLRNSLGDPFGAIEEYRKALAIFQEARSPEREAVSLFNLGVTYCRVGETDQGLKYLDEAVWVAISVKDNRMLAYAQLGLSQQYLVLGDIPAALAAAESSLRAAETAAADTRTPADNTSLSQAHATLGLVYARMGNLTKALESHRLSLEFLTKNNIKRGQANCLLQIAKTQADLNDPVQAKTNLDQALALATAAGDRQLEAGVRAELGRAALAAGKPDDALSQFENALTLYRATEGKTGEAAVLVRRAKLFRDSNQLDKALADAQAAVAIVESLRGRIGVQNFRASFLAEAREYYETLIDVQMRLGEARPDQGFNEQALRTSEQFHARTLLESLVESQLKLKEGVSVELRDRQRAIQQRMNALAERLGRYTAKQAEQMKAAQAELEQLRTDYRKVEAEMLTASPRFAALTQPRVLSREEMAREVLDDDTALLEYALGETRSFAWLVTRQGMKTFVLPGRVEIERLSREAYDGLTIRNRKVRFESRDERRVRIAKAEAGLAETLLKLSKAVIGPMVGELKSRRLLIVPDGALHYVPFAALPVAGNETLLARTELTMLPSVSTLAILRRETEGRKAAPKTAVVLADPVFASSDDRLLAARKRPGAVASAKPTETKEMVSELTRAASDIEDAGQDIEFQRLPYTRREAEAVRSVAGDSVLALDFNASRQFAIGGELGQYRIVHFATHGLLDSVRPELSGLILSLVDEQGSPRDGYLRMHEVFNLKLPAELVVLSGCRTGLGKEIRGEGLVGLTRGFMYAGAERVMVSLWDVNDEATAELMTRFYKYHLGTEKLSPSAALRAAQLEMAREKKFASPYYWASFTLQGEPK